MDENKTNNEEIDIEKISEDKQTNLCETIDKIEKIERLDIREDDLLILRGDFSQKEIEGLGEVFNNIRQKKGIRFDCIAFKSDVDLIPVSMSYIKKEDENSTITVNDFIRCPHCRVHFSITPPEKDGVCNKCGKNILTEK